MAYNQDEVPRIRRLAEALLILQQIAVWLLTNWSNNSAAIRLQPDSYFGMYSVFRIGPTD